MTARYPLVLNGTTIQELQIGDTVAGLALSGDNSDITSMTGLTTALSVAQGGTGATALTGILTGNGIDALTAATAGIDFVAPGGALGTPSSGTLTNCTFPTLNQNTTGTAAGLSSTLAVNKGGTGATTLTGILKGNGIGALTAATVGTDFVAPGGALGTPSSGTLTNCSGLPYSGLTGTVPTWNQNTTGTAAGLSSTLAVNKGGTGATTLTGILKGNGTSAFSVATAGTDYLAPGGALGTPSSGALTNCTGYTYANLSGTAPTWNQNTTGTAANVTGTVAIANGGTGTTSSTGSGSNVLSVSPAITTPTITNPTITNPTITNYVESVVAIGTVTTSATIDLTNGTVQTATLTASTACTFTMPAVGAGKSFILLLKQSPSGNGSASFTGVKWGTTGAPTITATASKLDLLTFVSDGTNWYGSISQGYTP